MLTSTLSANRESVLLMPGSGVSVEVKTQLLEKYSQTYREHVTKPIIIGFNFRSFEDLTLEFFAAWLAAPRDDNGFVRKLLDFGDYHECVAAWRFGGIMQVREFQDYILRVVLHYYCNKQGEIRFDPVEVASLLEEIPRQNTLHRLLVNVLCHYLERLMNDEMRKAVLEKLKKTTLYDISSRMLQISSQNGGLMAIPNIEIFN